ncbi:gluconokinase [Nibrella saemangeumensis]|uniref:Gluconokinase n=1 Tax=Nibrella saemangeumensis TaxID=1084526 RepID=A0ABP8MMQ0_9BACT
MNCIVGVDIGTTNVKALAMSVADGQVIAQASAPVTTLFPKPTHCEQDPNHIWQELCQVLDELVQQTEAQGASIDAVCFSSAMHSLLAIDAEGKPLTNAIIWSDNRAERQAKALRPDRSPTGRDIYRHTGTPIHPMTPLCKLAWLRDNQPRLLKEAARFISIKEYIWHKLTGHHWIDYSIATAMGLFNSQTRNWYAPALKYVGIRASQLSEPKPTTTSFSYQKNQVADKTALPDGVTLYIGASDGCLANLGAGAIAPGVTTLTIGTSGAIRRTSGKPLRERQGRLFSYILDVDEAGKDSYFVVGGPTNNGANVLQWLAENLTRLDVADALAEAEQVPAGADGLLFLPYLQGERAPLWNANVRGAYLNVSWQHTRAHFIRAALEGVMFNVLTIEKMLARYTGPTRVIHANGGFAQSEFWVQMLADIFGVPVQLNASNESGAIGAILLAMKARGLVGSLAEAARQVEFGQTFQPNPDHQRVYRKTFRRFQNASTMELYSVQP